MSHITVRRATPADVGLLVPLFESYRAFYKCAPDAHGARAFLQQRLDLGQSTVFIAIDETKGGGAGFVQLYPVFSSLRMKPALILNDLYVEPAYRGQHVSRMLMEAARTHAVQAGAAYVTLETARDNDTARRLYESLGYEAELHFLQYVLDVGTD